jgi:hypothetical protein
LAADAKELGMGYELSRNPGAVPVDPLAARLRQVAARVATPLSRRHPEAAARQSFGGARSSRDGASDQRTVFNDPIESNMAKLGRIRLMATAARRFLVQLERHDEQAYS